MGVADDVGAARAQPFRSSEHTEPAFPLLLLLLRALRERELRRLGSDEETELDVRSISSAYDSRLAPRGLK